ncbi:hypothetical protein A3850_014650 [Lewinella sp. 4G2]|nr:hypothetical protein A3850_014650 [Lewinella sp. 4G2]
MLFSFACTSSPFDDAAFPEDQRLAKLAFKRMSEHGRMEPVLEEGSVFKDWQFEVTPTTSKVATHTTEKSPVVLADGSGITYSAMFPNSIFTGDQAVGFATGTVTKVERDLAAGTIRAELEITTWRPKK